MGNTTIENTLYILYLYIKYKYLLYSSVTATFFKNTLQIKGLNEVTVSKCGVTFLEKSLMLKGFRKVTGQNVVLPFSSEIL